MNKYNNSCGGVGIATVVQIVFIILKLVGVIDWPWGIVLIPLWIELGLTAFVLLLWWAAVAFKKRRKK